MSRSWRIPATLRYTVAFGILAYLLTTLDLRSVYHVFAGADLPFVAAGMMLLVGIRLLGAWQLAVAIRHQRITVSVIRAFVVNTIAGFYSLFLPGGQAAGAVVKWHALSRPNGSGTGVLATMFFVRVINTLFVLVTGVAAVLIENPFGLKHIFAVAVALIVLLAASTALLLQGRVGDRIESLAERGPRWIPAFAVRGAARVLRSFARFRSLSPRQTAIVLFVPFAAQVGSVFLFTSAARALHLDIPLVAQVWIIAVVYLIQSIPASSSGLGIREGAFVLLLPRYGVDRPQALALSLLLFGYNLLLSLAGGVIEAREKLWNSNARRPRKEGV